MFIDITKSFFAPLFRAINSLPKTFTNVVVSAATCFEIPFTSLLAPDTASLDALPRSIAHLPGSFAYTHNQDYYYCSRSRRREEWSTHQYLASKILNMVSKDEVKLAPFFVRTFIPPPQALGFNPVSDHNLVVISPFF
ncbi:uncharacterized protein BX663DRAFT_255245 [Cokeromyces recurvatus]|uniref:uncharacterized protein n=1 Tax=Cokeromyces recurvatus TaxID=90255 RepID=UPI002220DC10|nr:uncharacterized protein BX663DRAFT_255245 [Cokeromyces recurvatus]KAI7906191.1 hypothetical protein BX663DRAFT_255245 [Cokeromyces recurvatus]